jgi:hypothetical protein
MSGHTPIRIFMGEVTDGAGKPIEEVAYLCAGSDHGQNPGDCDIEIKGGRAREVARLIAAAPEQRDAMVKLTNEVRGWLSAYEHELRNVLGNTNYAVMQVRVDEASAAIEAAIALTPAHGAKG